MDKSFVSPMDRFLQTFNATHKPSLSQIKEIKTHEAIATERDQSQAVTQKNKVQWPED